MNMDSMYKLDEMCCKELDKIVERGDLSSSTLQQAHMLTDTVKNVYKIEMLSGEASEGYAQGNGDWEARGSYARGNSYANRGQHYVRGHYSRDGGNGGGGQSYYNGRSNYTRDGRNYSRDGDKEEMIQRLERMMDHSEDPNEAAAYKRAMEQLRNA